MEDQNVPSPLTGKKTLKELSEIVITPEEVRDQLKTVNVNKSQGPDKISPYILNKCWESLSFPVWKLINWSVESETLPYWWKRANITPIHKKGERDVVGNYRPVALTSVICKILEKILFKHIYNFLNKEQLISNYQSGFRPGDGTTYQLIDLMNDIYESFDDGRQIQAVFLDTSKAFDRVWIRGLLSKLNANGIRGKLLRWIMDYLTNREQRVTVDGSYSNWEKTEAGVPQGSVLGPLLFLIFINDLTEGLKSNVKLFADDTMLYVSVENAIAAASILNNDLKLIEQWSKKWLVTFNASKTETVLFTLKQKTINHPPLYLNNEIIKEAENHTHLGLTLNCKGKWDQHISNIIAKANYSLNAMRR